MNTAALAKPQDMIVQSDLLGAIEVTEDDIIDFPAGLFGFPECRSFILLPAARDGVYWLQSIEHGALAFLLADPFQYFDGYSVELPMADRKDLQVTTQSEIIVLAIVTLPRSREEMPTANLQGPLAINLVSRRGKQLAIGESEHGIRCPISLAPVA